jgi:hypothetical protein
MDLDKDFLLIVDWSGFMFLSESESRSTATQDQKYKKSASVPVSQICISTFISWPLGWTYSM